RRGGRRASARRIAVCQRTRFAGRRPLPFAGARQLLDLADDELAFDAAESVHEEGSVEVIHFVLKRARQQPHAFALLHLTRAIESLDDDTRRPYDGRIEAGHAEASFFFELHAVAFDE